MLKQLVNRLLIAVISKVVRHHREWQHRLNKAFPVSKEKLIALLQERKQG